MNDKPHVDEQALTELKDVMEDEFDILIETFLKDSRDRISHLRKVVAENDADAIAGSAHSFRGSAVNIGAIQLGELCRQAEQAGKDQRISTALEVLHAIESEFGSVEQALKDFLS